VRNRWLSSGAIKLHVGAMVLVGIMLGLGWWQLQRALHGHTRSWAYAVQWPAFAVYAVYLWWKLLREEPGFAAAPASASGRDSKREAKAAARAETEERELAEYNRRLAEYNERMASLQERGDRAGS
jgi:hypothetical protein